MHEIIIKRIQESISVKNKILEIPEIIQSISEISENITTAFKNGNKLLLAGNGGSFADAFHIAGEFVSRFIFDRDPLPAIALGGNNSILTAIGNDYDYQSVFVRELKALGKKDDVLLAISTSGNSKNIIEMVKAAKEMKIKTFGLTGEKENLLEKECKCIKVPSAITARIQEAHILIGHIICEIVEKDIFNNH